MENPYSPPSLDPTPVSLTSDQVSPGVIEVLRMTKGWARFLAVLGFIACGFIVIAAIGIGLAGGSAFSGPRAGVLAAVYLALAVIYLIPTIKLNRYASSIADLVNTRTELNLVAALDAQRSFWKTCGIFAIITIVIYIFIIFAAIGTSLA